MTSPIPALSCPTSRHTVREVGRVALHDVWSLARRGSPESGDDKSVAGLVASLPSRRLLIGLLALVGALALVGCGGSESRSSCTEGQVVSCPCVGGVIGVQVCGADSSYGACSCDPDAGFLSDGGQNGDAGFTGDGGGSDDADGGSEGNGVRAVGNAADDVGSWFNSRIHISGDGSCVIAHGWSPGVVSGDDIGTQVYMVDLTTGVHELVSVDDDGEPRPNPSERSSSSLAEYDYGTYVSHDCRYVVFQSPQPLDQDAGDSASRTSTRIFLRDLQLQETQLVSLLPASLTAAPSSISASMSSDGDRVLYISHEEGRVHNYVSPRELYLWERETDEVRWIEVRRRDGSPLGSGLSASTAFLSGDGQYIFARADNRVLGIDEQLGGAWIRIDVETAQWVVLELTDAGLDGIVPSFLSSSSDGEQVVYSTTYPVIAGTNPSSRQSYVLNIERMTRTVLTAGSGGLPGETVNAERPMLSANGQFVSMGIGDLGFAGLDAGFSGQAAVRLDLESDEWLVLSRRVNGPEQFIGVPGFGQMPSISADGSVVAFWCQWPEVAANEPPANWVELCVWSEGESGGGIETACQSLARVCAQCEGEDENTCLDAVATANDTMCSAVASGLRCTPDETQGSCEALDDACSAGCDGLSDSANGEVRRACREFTGFYEIDHFDEPDDPGYAANAALCREGLELIDAFCESEDCLEAASICGDACDGFDQNPSACMSLLEGGSCNLPDFLEVCPVFDCEFDCTSCVTPTGVATCENGAGDGGRECDRFRNGDYLALCGEGASACNDLAGMCAQFEELWEQEMCYGVVDRWLVGNCSGAGALCEAAGESCSTNISTCLSCGILDTCLESMLFSDSRGTCRTDNICLAPTCPL